MPRRRVSHTQDSRRTILSLKDVLGRTPCILVFLLPLISSAHGYVSPTTSSLDRRTMPLTPLTRIENKRLRRSRLSLFATVLIEKRSFSSSGEDDDNNEYNDDSSNNENDHDLVNNNNLNDIEASFEASKIPPSNHRNGQAAAAAANARKKKRFNPAMSDIEFLRKRTAKMLDTVNTLNTDPSPQLSSRGMKVDKKTFHFLFDSWAFSGEKDAPEQCLQLLETMEVLGAMDSSILPDVRSFTKVINAISRSGRPTAGLEAEKLLTVMDDFYRTGTNYAAKPNTFTYTAIMEAHANSGAPGSAERAEELCEIMVHKFKNGDADVRPTARAFNAAIHAYAKNGQAAKAEALLERMEFLHESGIPEAKPHTFNYNALISAWANCGDQWSALRAEEVLERMRYLAQAGDQTVRPSTVSYNAVIDAYAKSGEEGAAQRAEELLLYMQKTDEEYARPNTRSFNSVINAWAKSGHPDAANKAEDLLDLMEKLFEEGNSEVRPDVHSFCTVINAWARSQHNGKAERSLNLYKEMKKLYNAGNKRLRPNVVAVNAVMNACAFTNGDVHEQNRAMEIAHRIQKELEQSPFGSPDQVTYGTFLKVCANQMPDCNTREQLVEVLFKKCCKDGQVGNLVIQQLKAMTSPELFESLIGQSIYEEVDLNSLPEQWRCNVVEGKWHRRRNLNRSRS